MDALDVESFLTISFTMSVLESNLLSCRDIIDKNAFEDVDTILVTSRLKYELERHLGGHRCLTSESHVLLWHMDELVQILDLALLSFCREEKSYDYH